jgi:CheY-like chemotaxis protein
MPFAPSNPDVRRPTVLIAEDDAASRGMLAEILHMHGMDTIEAGDGQEAVMMAFERHPDAILLDLVMPVMDGVSAARAISSDRETSGTPIIAVSGMLSEEMRRAAIDAGCVAYMQKPFAPSAIVAQVQQWLGRRAHASVPPA